MKDGDYLLMKWKNEGEMPECMNYCVDYYWLGYLKNRDCRRVSIPALRTCENIAVLRENWRN